MAMRVSQAAALIHAPWHGPDSTFSGCSIDSRTLQAGNLFVALPGEHAHGHAYLDQAKRRGAAAALVEAPEVSPLPSIVVPDSRQALGRLAAAWRRRFACPLAAITGSNGKTTVKEMLAAILGLRGPVLATRGNLNNDIGMPLTLSGLGPEHRFAVLEMGANHPGEIAGLAAIAAPDVAILTQCAPAHLEGFGSIDGVARAKGELIQGLAADGTAVINAEDAYAPLWGSLAGPRRVLGFALDAAAEVSGEYRADGDGSRMRLRTPLGEAELRLPLPGRHNAMNALAAAAGALALGLPLADIAQGLGQARPVAGRLQLRAGAGGVRIIDDTYNANPASLAAAIAVLADYPAPRWLVLGDMAELGGDAADYHRRAGRLAREAGLERLYALGVLSREAVAAFGPGARHFDDHEALIEALRAERAAGVTALLKGSRSMHLERVVEALTEDRPPCC